MSETNKLNRGLLIVFEGIDQSGKSTTSTRVKELLDEKGEKVIIQSFPDRSNETGKLIDSYLNDKTSKLPQQVIHLIYSANRWEVIEKIKEHLENGTTVICDRYSFSGLVYSIANGLDKDWCLASDKGLLEPDVVIFFDLSLDEAQKRRRTLSRDVDNYENIEFQRKVKRAYDELRSELNWITIDANVDKETLAKNIVNVISELNISIKK